MDVSCGQLVAFFYKPVAVCVKVVGIIATCAMGNPGNLLPSQFW